MAEANAALSVLVAHGEADNVVPLSEGRRLAASVQRLAPKAQVQFRSYTGMGHTICEEEVSDLRAFLRTVIGEEQMAGDASAVAGETAGCPERIGAPALKAMSTAQLKAHLRELAVPTADCFERSELLARALDNL